MTIQAGNIKLVPSQVMLDVDGGGGAPGLGVIADAVSNSIFPDISELDRALGRVYMRKVFGYIDTLTTDTYMGANFIIAVPPTDPNVSVTAFQTSDVFDTREQAVARLEAFLAPGAEWGAILLENHIEGQKALQFFQRVNSETPAIGKTLMLVCNEGLSNEFIQYVRTTRVAIVERDFTYDVDKDYKAWVVTIDISDPLKFDFPGTPANRAFARGTGKTMIRDTVVADAATYQGTVELDGAVSIGDLTAKGSSIFTQLVPSAQTEVPILNALPNGQIDTPVQASTSDLVIPVSSSIGANTVVYTGNPITPGTLTFTAGAMVATDSGGTLFSGAVGIAVVDYALGIITFAGTAPTYSGSKTFAFKPAAAPQAVGDTSSIDVSITTRAYNYVRTLPATIAPKSLRVSYRAQGKWYDLRDDGSGAIRGADAAFGTGTISYGLGTLSITLGALPDVGSKIIIYWGSKANYINRSAVTPTATVELQATVAAGESLQPSGITVTWNDGGAKTATDNGIGGFTGDATGTIDYKTGKINLLLPTLPAGGQVFNVAFDKGTTQDQSFTAGDVSANIASVNLLPNVQPGSVDLTWEIIRTTESFSYAQKAYIYPEARMYAYDDKLGNIKVRGVGTTIGSINYTTGVVSFDVRQSAAVKFPVFDYTQSSGIMYSGGYYSTPSFKQVGTSTINATSQFKGGSSGSVKYRTTSSGTAINEALSASAIIVDLTPDFAEPIIPGSVNFTLGNRRYYDNGGALLYGLDPLTGNGISGGTIDYSSGRCTVASYGPGETSAVTVASLLTSLDDLIVDELVFRVPVSPVRSGSVQLIATLVDGTAVSVIADINGNFISQYCNGQIDYETGVCVVAFGEVLNAAGNEGQPWYDVSLVFGAGKIRKPKPAYAPTVRFNATGYSYLPLPANILGIDPVRLPQDGRVPIFRPGAIAVIGHTGTVAATTVSNGQTINCGRTRLSRIRVIGDDGVLITAGYTTDLDAGTINFVDVTGYSQPVTVEHRIEDMLLVSDAQIDGTLAFTRPVTHNYPATGAYISSALLWGDVRARVSLMFDQSSWDNTWLDAVKTGFTAALPNYNNIGYPVEVTNSGAITERWAIRFDSSTAFSLIGEHVGQIATGSINSDFAPINPRTGTPYMTIESLGWGSGWGSGMVQRINTVGATPPVWLIRTVQQGPETVINDSFTALIRGDVDRP